MSSGWSVPFWRDYHQHFRDVWTGEQSGTDLHSLPLLSYLACSRAVQIFHMISAITGTELHLHPDRKFRDFSFEYSTCPTFLALFRMFLQACHGKAAGSFSALLCQEHQKLNGHAKYGNLKLCNSFNICSLDVRSFPGWTRLVAWQTAMVG